MMTKTKRYASLALITFALLSGIAMQQAGDNDKYFEIAKNIEIFTNLYKEINTYYVDDVDPGQLMRTGVDAMLASLDPYTNYISEAEIESFRYMTTGKYGGIGASIRQVGEYVILTEPYEGYPADKAGMKAGDMIIAIDGKPAKSRSSSDVSDILKGAPGTNVVLTVRRPGESKDIRFTLTREEVNVPNVPYSGMVAEGIGYVALTTFTQKAGKNVQDAIEQLKADHPDMKGLILDLRGNGGGLLTEAINVCNIFVPKGEEIVVTKGRVAEWDRSYRTLNNATAEDLPLAVLIDHNSASASEIVSGVLQDLDRAVLVGQLSYGKGLVQNTRDIGYNSKLKLTTAKYYIPSGRCIQGVSYENGKPVNIPDSLRAVFRTRSGRVVRDGGGVRPDLVVETEGFANVLNSLHKDNLIFDYVTEFYLNHESIADVEQFRFTDFEGFLGFLEKRQFSYDTESEKLLARLREKADAEGYSSIIREELKAIEAKIEGDKKNDLLKYKGDLIKEIEREIVSRYYYQRGRIQIGLRNDDEVKEAIRLLQSPARYGQILAGQK